MELQFPLRGTFLLNHDKTILPTFPLSLYLFLFSNKLNILQYAS